MMRAGPTSEPRAVIWTIGHGTRTTEDMAAVLRSAGVDTLIDVRRYPQGRRQPHLARERLAIDLPPFGIAYEWWGETLGGRRSAPETTSVVSHWRSRGFAAYAAYMQTDAFRTALAALQARAETGEVLAVMCAETLWWRCHRRLIADALTLDGFEVRHLMDRPPGDVHKLWAAATATLAEG